MYYEVVVIVANVYVKPQKDYNCFSLYESYRKVNQKFINSILKFIEIN